MNLFLKKTTKQSLLSISFAFVVLSGFFCENFLLLRSPQCCTKTIFHHNAMLKEKKYSVNIQLLLKLLCFCFFIGTFFKLNLSASQKLIFELELLPEDAFPLPSQKEALAKLSAEQKKQSLEGITIASGGRYIVTKRDVPAVIDKVSAEVKQSVANVLVIDSNNIDVKLTRDTIETRESLAPGKLFTFEKKNQEGGSVVLTVSEKEFAAKTIIPFDYILVLEKPEHVFVSTLDSVKQPDASEDFVLHKFFISPLRPNKIENSSFLRTLEPVVLEKKIVAAGAASASQGQDKNQPATASGKNVVILLGVEKPKSDSSASSIASTVPADQKPVEQRSDVSGKDSPKQPPISPNTFAANMPQRR